MEPFQCKCSSDQDLVSIPIQVPFSLGEISNNYLGLGVEECLADISKFINALIYKDKTLTQEIYTWLREANILFDEMRADLWMEFLIFGTSAEGVAAAEYCLSFSFSDNQIEDNQAAQATKFKETLNNSSFPDIWKRAIRHKIETLEEMLANRQANLFFVN